MNERPSASIGLAVYNGEKYLEQAIQSILAQTYMDFELIISDNASTDRTFEICQEYVAQDPRIRYSRNQTNIGGANNENLTFKMARGKYFRWAAHDDVCAPTLIEKCVKILETRSDVVLCYTKSDIIDESGKRIDITDRKKAMDDSPAVRFKSIAGQKDNLEEVYGLIRSNILKKTNLQKNYTDSDRTLVSELSLYGKFHRIDEVLFHKRVHAKNKYIDWRTRMAWFDNAYQGRIVFPFWMQFFDYFATVNRVPLNQFDKIKCYAYILGPWLFHHSKNMAKDLLVAGYMFLHSQNWRKERYADSNNWS